MRDRDRWWWLILIIGLVFFAGGVATLYFGVPSVPTDNPYITGSEYWLLVGMFGLLALVCFGGGLMFVVMAVRARGRHRARLVALGGDVSVMPLAEVGVDPALAPHVTEKPLELIWRAGTATRIIYVPMLGLQALAALVSVGTAIFSLVAPIFISPQPSSEYLLNGTLPRPMSVTELILRIVGASGVVAVVIVLSVVLVRLIPHLFGRPFGLSATNQGIDARTEWGSRIHMGWDEMRLLEVGKGGNRAKRRFDLYALGKRIGWTEYMVGLGAEYTPVGVTTSEMTLRQAALLNLIAARTGLAPRTLTKMLASKPTPVRAAKRSSGAIVLLVLALFLAGIIAADFLLPLTPVVWLNLVSAGSLVFTTGCLIIASLWMALARDALPAHASPPSVGAPTLDAPADAYILSWRIPLLRRLTLIVIGLCLAINLIPGVWTLLLSFGLPLPGYQPQLLYDGVFTTMGRFALGFVLAMFGVIGLGLVYGGTIARTVRIRADKNGLTTGSGRREQLMVWSNIQEISWGSGGRGQFTYQIESDAPLLQISWPADPQLAPVSPPGDGALPIGADELAALVAARIGKPIRVRE